MEADWEIEVGGDAPVIDALWPGSIDLREHPEDAATLSESAQLPALAGALIRLNADGSSVTTIKCDVWPVDTADPSTFNADELDAPSEAATVAIACYIDIVTREVAAWSTLDAAAQSCLSLCTSLRAQTLRQCRADLVVRRAITASPDLNLGITAYLTACGATQAEAIAVLSSALAVFADAVHPPGTPVRSASKLQ